MWDRARDLVQILIIPTIMWSLWVSRGVEIQRLQLEQSAAEVQSSRRRLPPSRSAPGPPRSGSPRSRRG